MWNWVQTLISQMQRHQHTGADGSSLLSQLRLSTNGTVNGYTASIATTATYTVPVYTSVCFLFAQNGSNSPYYNTAVVVAALDGTPTGPNPVIVGQTQTGGLAEQFYIGGATGLAITNTSGGLLITNNFAYTIEFRAVTFTV
jgi:hypothetical protein